MSRRRRDRDQDQSKEAQQAQEVRIHEEDDQAPVSDEGEGEDLQENVDRDYEGIEELDRYQRESADEEQVEVDQEARRKADEVLDERDRRRQRQDRRGQVDLEDYLQPDYEYELQLQQRRQMLFRDDDEMEDEPEDQKFENPEECKGRLHEWIKEESTVRFIKLKFSKFLKNFKGEGNHLIYTAALREMCTSNKQSIEISYRHLRDTVPTLAVWAAIEPLIILPYFNLTAYSIACKNYPAYEKIFPEVFVKFTDLPLKDQIRDLRYIHLNKLIHVSGVITKRSPVYSQRKKITFKCYKCGQLKEGFYVNNIEDTKNIKLGQCISCLSKGPFLIDKSKTVYRNHQVVTIQEAPAEVPAGRIPRQKEVVLLGDNIDIARPGDEVDLIGIYINRYQATLNATHGFPVFSTIIEANYIKRVEDKAQKNDQQTQEKIKNMKRDPRLATKLMNSIAPNIYGHDDIKMGLLLAMFGGVEKIAEGTHKIRGDINVLMIGDPGTAKSQFLKSVQKAFYRCIYTTGKGASAVGLTASVKKDFASNEWVLEAGALVLADKGICLIDEFDKMNEHDRTSIHEAMEQQSISISKAGIVTSLRARCSVIAAANPIQGRYNSQLSFKDNIDLSDPILSRFDVLFVVKDEVNDVIDDDMSTFVINQHMKTHPVAQKYNVMNALLEEHHQLKPEDIYDLELVKKYIKYARENCSPKLTEEHTEQIKNFYMELRNESKKGDSGLGIAVRHIQSIIRLSTAHAKMHLRSEVRKQDVAVGIKMMFNSFVNTQKHSTATQLTNKFKKYL